MALLSIVDATGFIATSGGTGTFVVASGRPDVMTLAQAQSNGFLADGQQVSYFAQDSLTSPTQREWGHGTYSLAGNSIARTTVIGTVNKGTAGTGSALNFSAPPYVYLGAFASDIVFGQVTGTNTTVLGGDGASSQLTLESTAGTGTTDFINFKTGSQVEAGRIDSSQRITLGSIAGANQTIAGTNSRFEITNNNIGIFDFASIAYNDSVGNGIRWANFATRNASAAGGTIGQGGDVVMQILAYGDSGVAGSPKQADGIFLALDANASSSGAPGRLTLATGNTSGTLIEALRIDSNQVLTAGGSSAQSFASVTPGLQNLRLDASATYVGARYSNDTTGPGLWMAKSRNATLGSHTIVQSGDAIGTIGWIPDNGSNLNNFCATIQGVMDGTPSATSLPGRIVFNTTAASAVAVTEAMRIDNSQRVYIGETASQVSASNCNIASNTANFDVLELVAYGGFACNINTGMTTASTNTPSGGAVTSGSAIQNFSTFGSDGTAYRKATTIMHTCDATPASSTVPGRIGFFTTPAGASQTPKESFRIDSNQQMRFMFTPAQVSASTQAQIRGDDQTGISIATSSSAVICSGHANFIMVLELTNSSYALYISSGAATTLVSAINLGGFSWVASTATPAASQASVAFSGSSYSIFTGSGLGTRTYKVFMIKLGAT